MKHRRRKTSSLAFTLAELLVAVPLMALLLVSMGAAINASMDTFEDNSRSYSLNQAVRIIGERMTREIRSATNADCATNLLNIYMSGNPDQVQYLLDDGTLYHVHIDNGQSTSSTLLGPADNLSVQAFTIDMTLLDIEGTDYATLVTVKIDVLVAGQTRSFTFSASPRKNLQGF